ncbi:MAG: hypothetical protein CL677_01405 [Bdellovibrionaceae bacterium]|nr:hypothetical protein [Pseudobdellovibrionaceae bacterium]|tara:strand:- start:135540 stop:136382 length:843 start_codon:yes stop_codon:yes gene_type:complete
MNRRTLGRKYQEIAEQFRDDLGGDVDSDQPQLRTFDDRIDLSNDNIKSLLLNERLFPTDIDLIHRSNLALDKAILTQARRDYVLETSDMRGGRLSPNTLSQAFESKEYSLKLYSVDSMSDHAMALRSAFTSVFNSRFTCNLYFSVKDGAAIAPPHIDSYDVFLFGCQGEKTFHLKGHGDYTLTPGKALYIPKHVEHHALPCSDDTIHLTLGYHPLTFQEAFQLAYKKDLKMRQLLDSPLLNTQDKVGCSQHLEKINSKLQDFLASTPTFTTHKTNEKDTP